MFGKRYEGKVAIVTASTQGIGFSIAERLGLEGASVVVSSRKQVCHRGSPAIFYFSFIFLGFYAFNHLGFSVLAKLGFFFYSYGSLSLI